MEVNGNLQTAIALVLGESPKVPSGPQNRSGHFTEDKIFYACLEMNPDFSAVHPTAYSLQ